MTTLAPPLMTIISVPNHSSFLSTITSPFLHERPSHTFYVLTTERKLLSCPKYSSIHKSGLPAFEGAGIDVAREFVEGEKIKYDVRWIWLEQLDMLAKELIDLHRKLQVALTTKDGKKLIEGPIYRVERLGQGVYAQKNRPILDLDGDRGSPFTITREERINVVLHALEALHSEYAVSVTVQAGIGKTRGSMMYSIQFLFHRQVAVLYVG